MVPILAALAVVAALVIIGSSPVAAPFIYTLF